MNTKIDEAKAKRIKQTIVHYLFITLGCLILAFGDAAFIVPLNLVTGGVASISIIVNYFLEPVVGFGTVDIVTYVVQIFFLILGLIFLGKKFAAKTLYASLVYPAFFTLFYRTGFCSFISNYLIPQAGESVDLARSILAGIFGGALVGAGVGVAYMGNGSTGGVDVICSILAKYARIKESITSFTMDASLVVLGMVLIKDIPNGLIGILSALTAALLIQYLFVNSNGYVIADIITNCPDEINDYVWNKMERTTTVIQAMGSYRKEKRNIIRVAFSKKELPELKAFIARVDPKAFVTFTNASTINGEGFDSFATPIEQKINSRKKKNGK